MKKPTTLIQHNLQWSQRVFAEHGALTKDQFVEMAREYIFGEGCEGLYENISQCQSEINMYGDSGPGTMLRLQEQIGEFNNIADQYERLTGQSVGARPKMPSHPVSFEAMSEMDSEYD